MKAKVMFKKFLFVLTFLVVVFVVMGCTKDPTFKFEKDSFEVEVGDIIELKPIVTELEEFEIEYAFDTEGIIVDKGENKFEAVKAGEVKVTASLKGYDLSLEVTVTVKEKPVTASITLSVDKPAVGINGTIKISAEIKGVEGDKTLTWSSKNEAVATVDETGLVKILSAGEAEIVATLEANPEVSASIKVTGLEVIEYINLNADEYYYVGTTADLIFSYEPSTVVADFIWESSDESVCTVEDGKITAIKGGNVKITVKTTDGSAEQFITFKVYNLISEITYELSVGAAMEMGTDQKITATLDAEKPFKADPVYTSSNTEILEVDNNGNISAKQIGTAVITITASDGGPAKEEVTIEVTEPTVDAAVTLADPAVAELAKGTEHTFNGMTFMVGYTAFPTLEKALDVSTGTVYVVAGKYAEDVTITKDNIKLIGPNSGINPLHATRLQEAEITGKITVGAGVKNVVVKGFAFTETGCLDTGDIVDGLEVSYNNVYNTNAETAAWIESRINAEAVFNFWNEAGLEAKNIVVQYNKFSGVKETNILFARNDTVTVENNGFYNFSLDAIRVEGGFNYGVWTFANNEFKNDEVSGTNGIYFQSVSGILNEKYQEIIITNNLFENIGTAEATSSYNCAISIRTYQEKGLKLDILYNTFRNCINYFNLRNNGAAADTFTSNVNYNAFYGVPTGVYHRNVRPGSSDTSTSNLFLTNMDYNFFATAEGEAITDLTAYSDKFLDLASYANNFDNIAEYEVALKQLLGIEFEFVVSAEWSELEAGTQVQAEGFTWTLGTDAFATIAEAVAATENGGMIKVLAGNYDTELTIDKNDITLVGPNKDMNPQYENRFNEAVIANKINLAAGVQNFGLNGFELTGAAQILPGVDCANISFKYNVINATSADGVIRCPAAGAVSNIEFVGNYSNNNKSYRIIHVSNGLTGLTIANNYFENSACYDFINVGGDGFLAGEVVIKDNTFINSIQSFLYIAAIKEINVLIEGNYIENVDCTIIDFRTMKDPNGSAVFEIKNNTFKDSGADWCPIRIRPAGYVETNTITVNVNYNKFINSYTYNDTTPIVFVENPVFDNQTDPFKVIYNCDYNYYEINGEAMTELTNDNFSGAALSWENTYASEDEMPEYVVENQVKPTGVQITNKIATIDAFTTYQITFKLSPDDVTNKKVLFISSDSNVATVSSAGLISAKSEGTCTITVQCVADGSVLDTMTITVNPKERIEIRYEGNAVLVRDDNLPLDIKVIGSEGAVTYKSSDENIATVDADGIVTAKSAGQVMITVTCGDLTAEVGFTVIDVELAGLLGELVKGNNGVIYNDIITYIGSDDGSADYPHNIYGSANDFWAGVLPEVQRNMLSTTAANYSGQEMKSLEYIVIHDTAGSGSTSTAKANSGWCTNPTNDGSSWHYTIGNDGIYQQLEDNIVGWHAGDGTSWSTTGAAEFFDTGVAYEGDRPEVTIGEGGYFYINGKKSNVIAATAGANTRLNTLGMVCFKGENGNYVIPTTWESNQFGGPICARGGNLHSIGIETAVNMSSDVWLTWQITAKFCAELLVKYGLAADRVWFHNNFTNKKCPNTMITADLVDEFLELVYAEYEIAKNYSDYEIKFESHNQDIMDNEGRIIAAPDYTTNVSYTITITKDGQSESITLNTLVIGKYN